MDEWTVYCIEFLAGEHERDILQVTEMSDSVL